MNPWIILSAVLAWGGSLGIAYHAGGKNRANAIVASQAAMNKAIAQTAATVRKEIGEEVAGQIANIRVVNRTINKEVEREIHTVPVYTAPDCGVPESGILLLNAGRRGELPGAGRIDHAAVPAAADVRLKPPASAR